MALSYTEQLKHPLWINKQEEIFNRDNYSCLICGSKIHRLQVHHLCYFPGFMAWEYDNELMKTVCIQHHEQLTYDMPKLAGILAWDILAGKIQIP